MSELEKKIIDKARDLVKPVKGLDGVFYRCSAILNDGTFLPCVVIQGYGPVLALAKKRFEETRNKPNLDESVNYDAILKSFICTGNQVNFYDIRDIQVSTYSIPEERLHEIKGETSMGWTEFIGKMDDGKTFCFGTPFNELFFEMPENYTADRIISVTPAVRGLKTHDRVYREKPYFTCYISERII